MVPASSIGTGFLCQLNVPYFFISQGLHNFLWFIPELLNDAVSVAQAVTEGWFSEKRSEESGGGSIYGTFCTCPIPDGVIGIFHWLKPSGSTMALGSTQPLTEMRTRNVSWEWRSPVVWGDNLNTFMWRLSWNLRNSIYWNVQRLSMPVRRVLPSFYTFVNELWKTVKQFRYDALSVGL